MRKIKVLYILGAFGSGGVESVISNIHENIAPQKFKIDFVLFNGLDHSKKKDLDKRDSKIFYVTRSGRGILKNIIEIKKILKKEKYDIVHSHTNEMSILNAISGRLAKTPVIISHSHNTTFRNEKHISILRLGINTFSHKLVACSKDAGEKLFGKNADFKILKNAIESEKYLYNVSIRNVIRKDLDIEEKVVVGHVGRLTHQKNHTKILQVFQEFLKIEKNAVLLLIGDGELEKEIKEQIITLNIQKQVILLGPRNDVENLLQAMDIFLFPSHYEGLGVSLIEAQCSGLPCIVSDTITEEVVVSSLIKFVSLKENAEYWAGKMMDHYSIHPRINTKHNIVEAGYDIKSSVVELEELYSSLLKHKSRE